MPDFTVYPALELRAGAALRYESVGMGTRATRADAVQLAADLVAQGAGALHIYNLDGPFLVGAAEHSGSVVAGAERNLEVIGNLTKAVSAPVQFAGGVRDLTSLKMVLALGVKRVVLGDAAMREPELVKAAVAAHGDAVVVSLSVRDGQVPHQGWIADPKARAEEVAKLLVQAGVKRLIYQDVNADASEAGPSLVTASRIGALGAEVIVAGGIANLAHVRGCAAASGVAGVVVGKPLLLGKFTLKQALEIAATGLKDRK
ncbi:MAG: hypothetical protein IT463_05240 [Planctomycetes bacterium]|nr:hypothetical protein [Planctomycetota bacterium]